MFKQSRPCVGYLCAPIVSVREAAAVISVIAKGSFRAGQLRHIGRDPPRFVTHYASKRNLESPLPWRTMAALLNRPARFNARVVGKGACRDDKPHTPSLTGDGAP